MRCCVYDVCKNAKPGCFHQITRKELSLIIKSLEVAAEDTISDKVKSEYMDLRQLLKAAFG
jgi:hypothetical protein